MTTPELHTFPILGDNYVYFFRDATEGATGVVDPGDADGCLKALAQLAWPKLDYILVTHRHGDHVSGVAAVKKRYGGTVIGPAAEAADIPELDRQVQEGDRLSLGGLTAAVLATPGHTKGHIVYYVPEVPWLFAGDTLFAMGCGRLFEGNASEMWTSLQKIRNLPDTTQACCGHEYTQTNARFALDVDGRNTAVQARAEDIKALRQANKPTLPTHLAQEKATNPFLRADDPALAQALGMSDADPVNVFAELRQRRNRY